ncbi:MAG TPA: serine/threonine-protein kinase [Polyangiaceae bacterium]|nr:serine/threonine-protein kinase [Polyangiaceae bacterium]
MPTDPLPLCAGQSLGRYELLAPIAKGGMGQVWAGRLRGARGFQKLVAIKTLLAVGEDGERMERMLFEEARIAGLIQHSNVVQTIELGEESGTLYLAMEWVDGEPLSYLLSQCNAGNGMPLLIAVNLVGQALRGLQAAHDLCDESGASLGVVHRDVSPHNVLVSYTGVAKLVDFGIAKAMNQHMDSTATGEIKGKFAYMAPEQILGNPVDRRADIFSAGIMLHLMTSGHHPFKNHQSVGVLHSITSSEPAARPSLLQAGYSRTLEAVVMRALEKDRGRRWASADEMRLALQRAVPEAFAVGIDTEVEAFMSAMCGQRALEKREAIRRVEQQSDRRMTDGRSLAKAGATAQSASSLRAVSVDTSDERELPPRLSLNPTLAPPPELAIPARNRRLPWIMAALIGVGLLGAFALKKPTQGDHGGHAASSAMVQLVPSSTAHVHLEASSPTPPEPVVPPAEASTKAASPIATPLVPVRGKPPKARPKVRSASAPSDLIAPDYAR